MVGSLNGVLGRFVTSHVVMELPTDDDHVRILHRCMVEKTAQERHYSGMNVTHKNVRVSLDFVTVGQIEISLLCY